MCSCTLHNWIALFVIKLNFPPWQYMLIPFVFLVSLSPLSQCPVMYSWVSGIYFTQSSFSSESNFCACYLLKQNEKWIGEGLQCREKELDKQSWELGFINGFANNQPENLGKVAFFHFWGSQLKKEHYDMDMMRHDFETPRGSHWIGA